MEKNLITIEKLSETSGTPLKILSSYVRKGFLSWEKQNSDGTRYYNKNEALKRLEEIKRLEKEGFTSKEIKEFLSKYLFKFIKDLK